jgi:RNA polymerase sigma factor (sigma-70 family)
MSEFSTAYPDGGSLNQQPAMTKTRTTRRRRFPEPVPLPDDEFKDQLAQVIPHLRAFGRSLSGSRDLADDLVQETLLKAWAARKRFQAGTNMRAWTFIILRNLFLSQMRRARFKGEWDEITASKMLAAPASQDRHVELGDMQRALLHLPQPQREALILVGAGGFAYEEAAEICGCAVGTIKSRVARGRVALEPCSPTASCPRAASMRPTAAAPRRCRHHERGRRAQPRPRPGPPGRRGQIGAAERKPDHSRFSGAKTLNCPAARASARVIAIRRRAGRAALRRSRASGLPRPWRRPGAAHCRRRRERWAAPPSRTAWRKPGPSLLVSD